MVTMADYLRKKYNYVGLHKKNIEFKIVKCMFSGMIFKGNPEALFQERKKVILSSHFQARTENKRTWEE